MRHPGTAFALFLPGAGRGAPPGNPCATAAAFPGSPLAGGPGCAERKWAAAERAERCCGWDLAELEGAGERSAGGPRGPGERTAAGPVASAAAPGERGGDGAPGRVGAGASALFAGLQDLGVANGEDLKETLTNCTEPLKAIEQFQVGLREGPGAGARRGRGVGSTRARGGGARVYAELGEGACRRIGCGDTRACGGAGGGRGRGARVHGREECVWTTSARGGRRECLRGERAGGGVWMSVRGLCGWSQGEGVRMFAGRGPKHGCLRSEWEGGGGRAS